MPVDFQRWLQKSTERISSDLKAGVPRSLYYGYVGGLLTISKRKSIGTNVFTRNWDALVILDACRVDAIREVADEYNFIDTVDSIWSVGSTSFEWLPLTFQKQHATEIRKTAYTSGNPYLTPVFREQKEPPVSQPIPFGPTDYNVVNPGEFHVLDEVRRYGTDEQEKCVLPRTMTDRAVDISRTSNPDRLIVHYMQPHEPHIGDEKGLGQNVFVPLRKGHITKHEAWESYLENLRLVLDELEVLLNNIDAKRVIISADHGEAFGEFGFYGHQIGCPLPCVRKVPWIETTATDENTYVPEIEPDDKRMEQDNLEEQLADLGYL